MGIYGISFCVNTLTVTFLLSQYMMMQSFRGYSDFVTENITYFIILNWRSLNLSELIPIMCNTELTDLNDLFHFLNTIILDK